REEIDAHMRAHAAPGGHDEAQVTKRLSASLERLRKWSILLDTDTRDRWEISSILALILTAEEIGGIEAEYQRLRDTRGDQPRFADTDDEAQAAGGSEAAAGGEARADGEAPGDGEADADDEAEADGEAEADRASQVDWEEARSCPSCRSASTTRPPHPSPCLPATTVQMPHQLATGLPCPAAPARCGWPASSCTTGGPSTRATS